MAGSWVKMKNNPVVAYPLRKHFLNKLILFITLLLFVCALVIESFLTITLKTSSVDILQIDIVLASLFVFLTLSIVLFIYYFVELSILKPLEIITKYLPKLNDESNNRIPQLHQSEIGVVASLLNDFSDHNFAINQHLVHSEQKFKSIVAYATDGIIC